MKKLFLLIAMLALPALNGCIVVIHDTPTKTVRVRPAIQIVQRTYCGSCLGHRCGHQVYQSYQRTVVVQQTTTYRSSTRTYSNTRPHPTYPTRYYSAPAAPRVQRTTTYQSSPVRRQQASRSRAAVGKAPSRSAVSRAVIEEEERARTTRRIKRRGR